MTNRIYAVFATALLMFSAVAIADQGNGNQTRLKTRLSGAAIQGKTPEGSAEFRSDSNSRTRLNVEVENVNLPAETVLTVSIQQGAIVSVVGTVRLSSVGETELELESEKGTVPSINKGDMVTVSNAGTAILVGAF
jgi:hypothetical protein